MYWAVDVTAQNRSQVARAAVPTELSVAGRDFISEDHEMDPLVLDILQTDDYLYRRFSSSDDVFDVMVVFSRNTTTGRLTRS